MIQNFCGYTGPVNFICCLFFAFFIYFKNPRNKINRSFSLWQVTVALWSLGYFIFFSTPEYRPALFWARFLMIGAIWIPVSFLHFVFTYLELYGSRRNHLIIIFSVLISSVFLVANFTPVFVKGIEPRFWFKWWPVPGFLYHTYAVCFILSVLYAHYLFFRAAYRAKGLERKQLMSVSIGTAIAFSGGSTNFFLWYNIPVPPVFNFLVLGYFALTAYAVLNYKLWQIEVVVRRTVVFAGLFAMVMMTVALVMASTQGIAGRYIHVPPMAVTVFTALVAVGLYDPTRKLLIHITDRFLFQKKFDDQQFLKDASRGIALIQSMNHLAKLIVTFITMRARIKNAAVFVRSSETQDFVMNTARGIHYDLLLTRISETHPLIKRLNETKQPIRRTELSPSSDAADHNPQAIRNLLAQLKAEAVIPSFLGRDGEGIGAQERMSLRSLLVLGAKKSDEEYTEEDLNVFSTLAQESAIAIENARLYDEAVERSRELQRMNKKLDTASTRLMRSLSEAQATRKELEENKAILVEMKRRENLQRLAASIGHELNNPLAVFNMQCIKFSRDIGKIEDALDQVRSGRTEGCRTALRSVIEDEKFLLSKFEHFYKRIRSVADTVDGLLKAGDCMTGVNLKMIVDYSFEEIRFVTYSENLSGTETELDIPGHLPPVKGNAYQLQAVFVNLIVNAYHALNGVKGRKISVKAGLEPDEKMICVIVADNGCGMTGEILEKCFEYRFTTKGEKGTGIGLTVCKQTIERHGGTMAVESAAGKGTTFTILLPVWDDKRENTFMVSKAEGEADMKIRKVA
ncbi:MAG: GHKL domain-containing protein [Candidatus Omnitrophica bacterium]|nr:GHKL domain-containing protein [Candidatus Omnitrophota bacterium]